MTVYTPDINQINVLVSEGYLTSRKHPLYDLWILNYTNRAAYEPHWNEDTLNCRGLIIDAAGNVVGRPFTKFFNASQITLPAGNKVIEVTEKMDGSMIEICHYQDELIIVATRGSFQSEQSVWASQWIDAHIDRTKLLAHIKEGQLTLLFEVIYPDNRIVIDYQGFEGLVMIGARKTVDGIDLFYDTWKLIAEDIGVSTPKIYDHLDIDTLVEQAKSLSGNEEGFVVRIDDEEGTRCKIKGDDYLRIHRLLTHTTFRHILEVSASGLYDAAIEEIPDEFLPRVKLWKSEIDAVIVQVHEVVDTAFARAPKEDRKTFALWAKENVDPRYLSYMFTLLDGKSIDPIIYKREFEQRADLNVPLSEDEV